MADFHHGEITRRKVSPPKSLTYRPIKQRDRAHLLHELAHAMTSHADGRSDGHGPIFMGIYVCLLERYLRLDMQFLSASLREVGIEFIRDVLPVFVDP